MKKPSAIIRNDPSLWSIPPLRAEDNKYTRGHIVILGGEEMTGAARLAACAAQRAGAGMVTIAATQASWPVYAAALMSVVTRALDTQGWKSLMADDRVRAVVIGPGAGLSARTKQALRAAARSGKPLILDADALTLLATDAALCRALMSAPKILTPHAGEYARLAKAFDLPASLKKPTLAAMLAKKLNAVMVLKGSETLVSDGARVTITHPPAWLATAGTGDVLAGIIAALVGQGMPLFDAANAGVWIHAQAAREHGQGMIAEDVIATVPRAFSG